MTRYKIKTAALSTILAMALLFTACGKGSETSVSGSGSDTGTKTTATASKISAPASVSEEPEKEPEITYGLTLFYDFSTDYAVQNIVDAYNLSHPDKGIKIVNQKVSSYAEIQAASMNMAVSLSNGEGADILIVAINTLESYSRSGYLAPLGDLLPASIYDELIPVVVDECKVDGEIMGISPYITMIEGCIVSPDIYQGKEWTVQTMLDLLDSHPEIARTCVMDGGDKLYTGYGEDRVPTADFFAPTVTYSILTRNLLEEPFLDMEKKKADYYCEDFVRLLENIRRDQESVVTSVDINAGGKYLSEYFEFRDMAKLIELFSKYQEGYNFVGFPGTIKGGNRTNVDVFIVINNNSENKEAAAEFIDYAVSPEGQFAMGARFISVRKDAADVFIRPKEGMENVLGWGRAGTHDSRDYISLTVFDDVETFRSMYQNFVGTLKGRSFLEPVEVRTILVPELKAFYESQEDDPNAVAQRIQQKVQEYLDGLE